MIVVLGRPALSAPARVLASEDDTDGSPMDIARPPAAAGNGDAPTTMSWSSAGSIAAAAAAAGARVELVGSIGDDPDGDAVIVELGRAGIGHAALLRDPAGRTPVLGAGPGTGGPPPRLDAGDVRLGLGYLLDVRVLVLAELLSPDAEVVALEAAQYHGATVIAVVPPEAAVSESLARAGTVLEAPDDPGSRFAEVVGRFAASVDAGRDPKDALTEAVRATGWEPTAG